MSDSADTASSPRQGRGVGGVKSEPARSPCRLRWPLSKRRYVPLAVTVPAGRSQRRAGVTAAAPDGRNPS